MHLSAFLWISASAVAIGVVLIVLFSGGHHHLTISGPLAVNGSPSITGSQTDAH
jgi:hypothetical protein